MTARVLQWRVPDRRVLQWRGPAGMIAALERHPNTAIATIIGPTGPSSADNDLKGQFAYGDATPDLLGSVAAGKYAPTVRIVIDTLFDGTGASVSIGTLADHELLMPVLDMNAADEASYEVACDHDFATATDIYIFITPGSGATAGAGRYWVNII